MRKILVFNSISLDGYFCDKNDGVEWAHSNEGDEDFLNFVKNNASSGGILLFGRKTYQLMESFWPTEQAKQSMPEVAAGMNRMQKIVFSKSLHDVTWENSKLIKGDLVTEVRKLKETAPADMAILGSGSLVAQLSDAGLVDEYQVMIVPVVLGEGRSQFQGLHKKLNLQLTNSRVFKNGFVFLNYIPRK